ncbi:Uncharacterised protein [Mycobacteroides abscessus]|nr:Uncharacterised protein [Mycobacteroides abscessus]
MFDTFQRARIVWLPSGRPLRVCEMFLGGWTPPPSNVAKSWPSTKYSHTLVAWFAVRFHWNVTSRPVVVRGQGLLASSRIA